MPNQEEIEYWNCEAGPRWRAMQQELDVFLAPITAVALRRACVGNGEHVVDIGCGCGETALRIARMVGAQGSVFGVDVSEPMLGRARERVMEEKLGNVRLELADAAAFPFEPRYDLIFSRFGVMFFDDPASAFANIRRAARPGGRLSFACWTAPKNNPWMLVPLQAATPFFPQAEKSEAPDPAAPGPFAFADEARVRAILDAAGFSSIEIERCEVELTLGADAAAAARFAVHVGPTARPYSLLDAPSQQRVREAIATALAPYASARGVALPSGVWTVSARS